MKIGIVGYGRMGHEVEKVAGELGHDVTAVFDEFHPLEEMSTVEADVLIDFSLSQAVLGVLKVAARKGVPVVEGTTGWYDQWDEIRRIDGLTMIHSPNFSMGVYQFSRLVREAALLLGPLECYDSYVHEWHHSGKADSPSGTAIRLAQIMIDELPGKEKPLYESCQRTIDSAELHVSSTRVGRMPGIHEIGFDSEYDQIQLRHTAQGRVAFAYGALRAAEWILGREGIFTMDDWMTSSE